MNQWVSVNEEQDIPNIRQKQRKIQSVTEWCRCEKYGVMDTNFQCLGCGEFEALGYFELSDMRYDDRNAITEKVSATVL